MGEKERDGRPTSGVFQNASAVVFDTTITASALYVGNAGDLTAVTVGGQTVKFVNVIGCTVLPVSVTKVLSSGSTASNVVALW